MLEPLDQARYQSADLMISDNSQRLADGGQRYAKENLPQLSTSSPKASTRSPKASKTRIHRPAREDLTPQFSIKRISELKEGKAESRERKKGRKYSDDFEARRRVDTLDPSKMKSASLEKLSNDSGVWYCVRGSQDRPGFKQASSVSQPVDRASNQTAKLHRNAAYPRAYKHQAGPVVHPQKQANKGYAAMHTAKQALKEKHLHRVERKVEKIYKQTDDNKRRESGYNIPQQHDQYQKNMYPHTLPSAMYPPPHPSEYPGLYERLPPVLDEPLQPLPPINPQYSNMNMGSTHPEPASSPCQSASSTPPQEKTNSYAKPERLKITYKPYGLREYNTMKAGFGAKAGGLGPDTDSEEYKQKLARTNRKLEYAERIREKHHLKEFQKKKVSTQYAAPSKTVLGQEYARTIARPRVTKHRQLVPLEHLPTKPDSRSSQDVIAEKLLMNMHHRKIMSDLGQII